MSNILIIGAGQLGSRHLQGALLSRNKLNITVIDPSNESLSLTKSRVNDSINNNPNVNVKYQNELPANEFFYICIIATTSRVRAQITEDLLRTNRVTHIIFEKVLFQKLSDYVVCSDLLRRLDVLGWVNCPRRLYPTYISIKKKIDISKPINMSVRGSAWGLACNGIHFIDLFAYISEESNLKLIDSELSTKLLPSKREGFYELTGCLTFDSNGHKLEIECNERSELIIEVVVTNGSAVHYIDEVNKSCLSESEESREESNYISLLQSQLTGFCIDELIDTNRCLLTPFDEACSLHTPFISALLEHMSQALGERLEACPIT